MKTAQRQVQFEMDEQRKERQHKAEIRRQDAKTAVELQAEKLKAFAKAKQKPNA